MGVEWVKEGGAKVEAAKQLEKAVGEGPFVIVDFRKSDSRTGGEAQIEGNKGIQSVSNDDGFWGGGCFLPEVIPPGRFWVKDF